MLQTTPISTKITRDSTTAVESNVTRDYRKRAYSPYSSGDNCQGSRDTQATNRLVAFAVVAIIDPDIYDSKT